MQGLSAAGHEAGYRAGSGAASGAGHEAGLPDHGLVIEERAGFARLYGSGTEAGAGPNAGTGSSADTGAGKEAWNRPEARMQGPQNSVPDIVPSSASGTVPDTASDAIPEAVPDAVPAALSGSVCDAFCTVYSLAALRLQSMRHGIEIWPIPDRQAGTAYWVFAARLGRLSARADRCFSSLEEALSLAARLQESLDLQEPRVLDAREAEEELQKLALADRSVLARAKLRPLSLMSCQILHNRGLRRGLATFLFFGVLVSACFFLSDPIAHRLFPESHTVTQKQVQEAEDVRQIRLHPERFFPSAWLTAPSPAASVLAFVPGMLNTPLAANGWILEEVSSGSGILTASWKAARASSLLLPPDGAERLASDATRARSVSQVPLPGAYARQWQALGKKDEVQALISELAQRFGLKMQLSWKPPRTVKKNDAVVRCPWTEGSLVLSQAPGTLFYDFGSLTECLRDERLAQSLVLSGITWNKKQWIMQGEVYARQ